MATEFTEFMARPIKLRNIEAKVIQAADPAALESAVTAFLDAGGERVLVGAYQVGELAILILYAE